LLEGQRAILEAMTLPTASPLLRRAPRGDGHPVLVLPGFGTGDGSTAVLRRYLKRQVITLGSPFGDVARPSNVSRFFRRVPGNPGRERTNQFSRALRRPPDVPCTAIFSRSDGIVHWSACLEPATDHTENIRVPGSHIGLGVNPLVLYAVADRLSQAVGEWKPFDRSGWRRHLYREAPPAFDRGD
jgi:hypothetical protein